MSAENFQRKITIEFKDMSFHEVSQFGAVIMRDYAIIEQDGPIDPKNPPLFFLNRKNRESDKEEAFILKTTKTRKRFTMRRATEQEIADYHQNVEIAKRSEKNE